MQPQGPTERWSGEGSSDATVFRDVGAPAPTTSRGSRTPVVVAVAVVLVGLVAVVATTVVLLAGGSDAPPAVAAPATSGGTAGSAAGSTASAAVPCTSTPTAAVSSSALGPRGLTVTLRATSSCAGGQTLDAAGTTVLLRDSGTTVAAGILDLAATPVQVDAGGTTELRVVFPTGSFWVVPGAASSVSATLAEPTPAAARTAAGSSGGGSTEVTAAAGTTGESPEALASAGLARQSAIDLPDVRARLAEQWEPQLSSKRTGLVADGTVYDDVQILSDHLALRARFPSARLLQSGQWQTYQNSDFWVTVSGVPSTSSGDALSWCRQQGIDGEHCSASFVSTVRGPTGVSAFQ